MGQLKLTPVVRHTYEDYAALPPDRQRWELIDGEFYVTPSPSFFHQALSLRLGRMFSEILVDSGEALVVTAPQDVILSEHDTVQPDLVVVKRARKHIIGKRGVEGPPDLAVEIVSPSSRLQDRALKRALYEKFRVPEYWLVDSDAGTVEVFVLTRGKYSQHAVFKGRAVARSKLFARLEVPLRQLFAPL